MAGTRLMARPHWQPARPVPLAEVTIDWRPDEPGPVIDPVQPGGSDAVRPLRADGTRFGSYADALAALRPPRLLANRTCYRILDATASRRPAQLAFGVGRYFDLINTSEAVAHESAHQVLDQPGVRLDRTNLPLRAAIGDPLDLSQRSAPTGICTLILRHDRDAGTAQMFLHWRDPASVAVNGGLYQVAPAGMFQPSHEASWNVVNDLGLWRAIAREVSEELLGTSEDYGSDRAPIDYDRWPFFAALTAAQRAGTLHGYWLGVGVDPLTLDVDLLTGAGVRGAVLRRGVRRPGRGQRRGLPAPGPRPLRRRPGVHRRERAAVHRDRGHAARGRAVLALAWQHREALLGT